MRTILIIFFLTGLTWLFSQGVQPDGSGTEDDPYRIENLDHLRWTSENESSWECHFIQTEDILAGETMNWNGGEGFSPIGSLDSPFFGTYDGQNNVIYSLYFNRTGNEFSQGMFGFIDGSLIQRVHLIEVDFTAGNMVGGIAGFSTHGSVIRECSVKGSVFTNGGEVGGIVGWNYTNSSIIDCYCFADVGGYNFVGGLVGDLWLSTVSRCYCCCNVMGIQNVGGLTGFIQQSCINDCYSMGDVTGGINIGGLTGKIYRGGYITDCYSTCRVEGDSYFGGLLGKIEDFGTVTASFWDIGTSGQSTSAGGTGLYTSAMRDYFTYFDAGWDFMGEQENGSEDIWGINPHENDGYPFLEWQGYVHNPSSVVTDDSPSATLTSLSNYPNPFNPTTTIAFSVPTAGNITVEVFNIKGQKVKSLLDERMEKGEYTVTWHGDDEKGKPCSSGVYLYKMKTGDHCETKKMIMMK